MLASKLILVLVLAMVIVAEPDEGSSFSILLLLLYISLNVAISLVKSAFRMRLLLFFVIMLSLTGYWEGHSLFILLLPLALSEFAKSISVPVILPLLVSVIPLFYIDSQMRLFYIPLALFSVLIHEFYFSTRGKVQKLVESADSLRLERRRLLDRLHENNEFLKQSAYASRLEERNRLSQQIHDDIGHSITGSLIQMEAARTLLVANPEKADELLGNAIGITREGIESIRMTLKGMKPPVEQVGLSRLKLCMDEFTDRHGIRTVLVHKGKIDAVRPIHWKIIMENCTEAFTNSLKYAGGAPIHVELFVLNKLIRLTVRDSGKGTEVIKKGLGLTGMEERAASIAGKLIIDAQSGFSVTTLLPLDE